MVKQAFSELKLRWLLFWEMLTIVVLVLSLIVANRFKIIIDYPLVIEICGYIVYAIPIVWLLISFRGLGIAVGELWGSFPRKYQWWKTVFLVIGLLFLSGGTLLVSAWALSYVVPSYVITNTSEKELYSASQTAFPILCNWLTVVSSLIVAPVVEEFVFRGVILHRLAIKLNTTIAVLLSSFFFGLIHFDVIGKSVFGIAMAILFVKSGKIAVPIIAHSFHNLLVLWVKYLGTQGEQTVYSIEQ